MTRLPIIEVPITGLSRKYQNKIRFDHFHVCQLRDICIVTHGFECLKLDTIQLPTYIERGYDIPFHTLDDNFN